MVMHSTRMYMHTQYCTYYYTMILQLQETYTDENGSGKSDDGVELVPLLSCYLPVSGLFHDHCGYVQPEYSACINLINIFACL